MLIFCEAYFGLDAHFTHVAQQSVGAREPDASAFIIFIIIIIIIIIIIFRSCYAVTGY